MGFNQESAANALRQCRNKQANAIDMLVSWGPPARELAPLVGRVDAEPSRGNSSMSQVTASTEGNASRQMVGAAALLAQALQSSPAGQQLLFVLLLDVVLMYAFIVLADHHAPISAVMCKSCSQAQARQGLCGPFTHHALLWCV